MATTITPPALSSEALAAMKALLGSITGSLPGEAAFVAAVNYATTVRATMDPAIAKRWDALFIQQAEDLQSLWRGLIVMTGLLK